MKIVYYGHFADWSGYGRTSRDFVLLLEEMGHEVYCRAVDFPERVIERGEEWVERCKKSASKYDVFIIHKSPWNQDGAQERLHEFPDFIKSKLHIYFTVFETSLWPAQWKANIEPFDKIVTFSQWQKEAAIGLMGEDWKDKISVIPHVIESEPTKRVRKENDPVIFYSEFSRISHRKGLDILLKSYYNAFTKPDNCILKIKIPISDIETFHKLNDEIRDCFQYKKLAKIEVCCQFLSDKQMEDNFNECDVYVSTARGEGFCIPLATAAVKGIRCIFPLSNRYVNFADYLFDGDNDWNSKLENVITDDFFKHGMKIDTSKMEWFEPYIKIFSYEMKEHYDTISENNIYCPNLREFALSKLSKKAVSSKLNEVLKN